MGFFGKKDAPAAQTPATPAAPPVTPPAAPPPPPPVQAAPPAPPPPPKPAETTAQPVKLPPEIENALKIAGKDAGNAIFKKEEQ